MRKNSIEFFHIPYFRGIGRDLSNGRVKNLL